MDSAKERRAARRFSMMLPLKVRFSKEDDVLEKQGETRDVSFRGLYFLIEAHVEAGTPIEFVLTLAATDHARGRRAHTLLRARAARGTAGPTPRSRGAHRPLRISSRLRLTLFRKTE